MAAAQQGESGNAKAQRAAARRILVLAGILMLWALAIVWRLFYLQVGEYGEFTQKAQRQQQRTVEVSPKRGIIYDRNGHELAMSVLVDSVFAVPSEVPDPVMAATLLGKVLDADPNEIITRLKSSHSFAWIARKLDAETAERIRAMNLKGIYFQKETRRYYPKRDLAAQVLGYVGTDDEGLAGIERGFDEQLKGKSGTMLISVDARQKWYGRVERQPEPGENVVLTLDQQLQYIAERELDTAMQQTKSTAGTIVVQNPHTGEILALANRPTFNPNSLRGVKPESMKNRAVSDIYEPGSTFKIVTIAAALEEKLTNPDEVIDCQMGSIVLYGHRIRDHHAFGALTVTNIMAHSSDVGTIKLGLRLGEDRFDKYIRAFGFGTLTGIELPGETRGLTKPASRWSKVSVGAISMGQEIGVSALQLTSMVSAIANDGMLLAPRLVAGVAKPQDKAQTVTFHPAEQRRVISPLTAAYLRRMLEEVVLNGTGRRARVSGYTAAGKTGTAQKIDPATGTYSNWRHVASFAGFAPVNKPAVTVVVILDSPVGPHEGGQVAAPVYARVMQQVLAYMNVPHDVEGAEDPRYKQWRAAADPELMESSPDRVAGGYAEDSEVAQAVPEPLPAPTPLKPVALKPTLGRDEKVIAVGAGGLPPPLEEPPPMSNGGTVVVDVEGGVEVPTFLGKSLRAAVQMAQQSGVEIDIVGNGVAREQSPPPGTKVPSGAKVAVRFTR